MYTDFGGVVMSYCLTPVQPSVFRKLLTFLTSAEPVHTSHQSYHNCSSRES